MNYLNLDIRAFDYRSDERGEGFQVQVLNSPVGEQKKSEETRLAPDLRGLVRGLEKRSLQLDEMIRLGESLAASLFPAPVRGFLEVSRGRLKDNEGLRVRLKLDSAPLSDLPWEYVYIPKPDTQDEQKDTRGFLVLNNDISIVRYEVMNIPPGTLTPPGDRDLRMVMFLASPANLPPLRLDMEQDNIQRALQGSRIRVEPCEATLEKMQDKLRDKADLFHFAGHGRFDKAEAMGYLAFVGEDRQEVQLSAEKLTVNLSDRGIRLAFLGACEAGRRDEVNAWTGVVPALSQAGIPAVLGMQYTIQDTNANTFSARFYRDLANGASIDDAVRAGRLAIFNQTQRDERDWGVPVLYLRMEGDGVLFPPGAPAPPTPRVTQNITTGLDALRQLMRNPEVFQAALEFKILFKMVRKQSVVVQKYKDLHDQLDNLQTLCYGPMTAVASELLLKDQLGRTQLATSKRQLQTIVENLREITHENMPEGDYEWIHELDLTRQKLDEALKQSDKNLLDEVKWDLRNLLSDQPSDINRRLVDAVDHLSLPELVLALKSLLSRIDPSIDPESVQRLQAGVDDLDRLNQRLLALKTEHNQWQEIDRMLRLIDGSLAYSLDQLEKSCANLKKKIEALCKGRNEDWATTILGDVGSLQDSIKSPDQDHKISLFRTVQDGSGDRFMRVDKALKKLCGEELRPTGERLDAVLEVML
jgi:hypothetical protein